MGYNYNMFIDDYLFKSISANRDDKSLQGVNNDILQHVCDCVSKHDSLTDILRELNSNPKLVRALPYMYNLDQFELYIGSSYNITPTEQNLQMANKHKLSCAPKLVASQANKNCKYKIIVVAPCPDAKSYAENSDMVTIGAKRKFFEENKDFALKTGMYNPAILNDVECWQITSGGDIYIDDWSELESLNNKEELSKFCGELRKICGLTFD